MDALELIQLGRRLVKIGEEAMRGGRMPDLPNGPNLVLRDVFAHPDTSIGDIAGRTSLPQSYVSESVSKLREQGVVETDLDPRDRRRTLVRVGSRHRRVVAGKATTPIEESLQRALSGTHPDDPAAATRLARALLEQLAEALGPAAEGPIVSGLRPARSGRASRTV